MHGCFCNNLTEKKAALFLSLIEAFIYFFLSFFLFLDNINNLCNLLLNFLLPSQVSFLHVNKPEIDLPEDTDPYDEKVYQKGKENLENFIANKYLVEEKEPIVYIYSQQMGDRTQYGIMLEASVEVIFLN